jgi:hypothetical protein
MPRGDKDGSIRETDSGFIVRKRYTDLHGASREKKRIVDTRAKAVQVRREIEDEIAAEFAGVDASQQDSFIELLGYCHINRNVNSEQPAHHLAATLLNLESALERLKELLPELDGINMKDFCNPDRFGPEAFARSLMDRLYAGLLRVKTEQQEYASQLEQ